MNLKNRVNEMRNFFNEKIDTYDQVHEQFMETKKTLIDFLEGDIKKVLDLGAGTGLELVYLFEKYPNVEVTAIDISENMLNVLSKRKFANRVTCICGDFFDLSFDGEYDAVISTSSLHHFNEVDKSRLYKKILSCLKINGQFINCDKVALSQEEQDNAFNEYLKNPIKYRHMDTPLTQENETKILKEAGFENVVVYNPQNIKDNYSIIKAFKK